MTNIVHDEAKDEWSIQDWIPETNRPINLTVTSEGKIYINGELRISIPDKIIGPLFTSNDIGEKQ